jgi:peptide/nickel transport system permease protein
MAGYVVRRILHALWILVGVNLLTFVLFFAVNSPDNIARLNLGGKRVTQQAIDAWKVQHGYDKPLWYDATAGGTARVTNTILYQRSLRMFSLDFGRADSGRDIGYELGRRVGPSLLLMLPMIAMTTAASIAFALALVFFRATYLDFFGTVLCVVMMSISSLFYIIVAQWLFGKVLHEFPISGYEGGADAFKFVLLPVLVGVVFQLGSEARLFRAMLLEEAGKDYVRTARAKGLAEPAVLFGHVLRNAWLPIMTHVGALLPYAFLGSLVFESFFGIPGLGNYTIQAITAQDFAIVHAMVFVGSALYIAAYLLTDLAYAWVDPRVRLA